MGACDLLAPVSTCVFPVLCLVGARAAAREGRLQRAEYLAKVAWNCSWVLLVASGVLVVCFVASGYPIWRRPEFAACFAVPVPIWFWSRSLYASIRARREAEALAPPPSDPAR